MIKSSYINSVRACDTFPLDRRTFRQLYCTVRRDICFGVMIYCSQDCAAAVKSDGWRTVRDRKTEQLRCATLHNRLCTNAALRNSMTSLHSFPSRCTEVPSTLYLTSVPYMDGVLEGELPNLGYLLPHLRIIHPTGPNSDI
jgi:hypothetical protein